jgi:hypothetical protein
MLESGHVAAVLRRTAPWRRAYFCLLETAKAPDIDLVTVLRTLYAETGRAEASFSSELIATIDPSQPVLDSVVLATLGLRLPSGSVAERIAGIVDLHVCVTGRFSVYFVAESGRLLVERFKTRCPSPRITETKMLDLMLWQTRTT